MGLVGAQGRVSCKECLRSRLEKRKARCHGISNGSPSSYPLQKGQTVALTIVLSKKSWVVAMSECRCKDTVSCRPLCTKMSTWGLGEARVAGLRGLRTSAPVPRWPRPGPGSARFRSTARTPRASFGAQRVRLACPAVWQLRPLGQSHALPRLFAESPAGRRGATAGDGLSAPSACRHSPPGSRGALGRGPGRRRRVSGARVPAASLGKERGSEWAVGGGARAAGGVDAAGFGKAPSE